MFDHNGMTETGPLGIECSDTPGSLTLLESVCLPEVIDPITGQAAPPGAEGELVVTTFRRTACPLIRYRTGDLVRPVPSSRVLLTLEGGLRGRVDDMVVVRGNNLHPGVLQDILHRFAEVAEYQVEIDQTGALTEVRLHVEPAAGIEPAALLSRIDRTIQDELLFRVEVRAAPPGSLPRAEMKARRWVRKSAPEQPTGRFPSCRCGRTHAPPTPPRFGRGSPGCSRPARPPRRAPEHQRQRGRSPRAGRLPISAGHSSACRRRR